MVKYARGIAMETTLIHQKDNQFIQESDKYVVLFYLYLTEVIRFLDFHISHFVAYMQPIY